MKKLSIILSMLFVSIASFGQVNAALKEYRESKAFRNLLTNNGGYNYHLKSSYRIVIAPDNNSYAKMKLDSTWELKNPERVIEYLLKQIELLKIDTAKGNAMLKQIEYSVASNKNIDSLPNMPFMKLVAPPNSVFAY